MTDERLAEIEARVARSRQQGTICLAWIEIVEELLAEVKRLNGELRERCQYLTEGQWSEYFPSEHEDGGRWYCIECDEFKPQHKPDCLYARLMQFPETQPMSKSKPKHEDLSSLISQAREHKMTPAEEEAQALSFAYGNLNLHNPAITRADVEKAATALKKEPAISDHIPCQYCHDTGCILIDTAWEFEVVPCTSCNSALNIKKEAELKKEPT